MGLTFKYKKFYIQFDEINNENINEFIYFIYENKEKMKNGEYLDRFSINKNKIINNIKSYINYYY